MIMAILLVWAAHAQAPEKSAFEQALEHEQTFVTQERWIEVGGDRYRQIVYKGDAFYMRFVGRKGEFAELDCDPPAPGPHPSPPGPASEIHRTKAFIDLLRGSCEPSAAGSKPRSLRIALNPQTGITLPDAPTEKLKNKISLPVPHPIVSPNNDF